MRVADIMLEDYDIEISNTRRTLERVPDHPSDWKPHEKSMPFGKLAMHCATLPMFGYYLIEDDGMDLAAPTRPHVPLIWTTREAALAQLEECSTLCRDAIAASSDERLAEPFPFRFGEHTISNVSRSLSFRQMCLSHLIHHTAQLGVYLRLNGIPVPGLYGPSADEPFGATK